MAATERITMTMRELDRFKVIQDVADGKLKPWRAAERLELTTRQVRWLVARLREHGPVGLVRDTGRSPATAAWIQEPLTGLCRSSVSATPISARRRPARSSRSVTGIRLAKETVRKLMTDAGLWMPRRQRPPKVYQLPARGTCHGELIQIDGRLYQSPPYPARRSNRNRSTSVPRNAARSARPAKAPTSGAKQTRRPHRHPRPLLVPLRSRPPAAPDGTAALSSTNTRARVRTTRRPARSPFSRG